MVENEDAPKNFELWQHHESGLIVYIADADFDLNVLLENANTLENLSNSEFMWKFNGTTKFGNQFCYYFIQVNKV